MNSHTKWHEILVHMELTCINTHDEVLMHSVNRAPRDKLITQPLSILSLAGALIKL